MRGTRTPGPAITPPETNTNSGHRVQANHTIPAPTILVTFTW
jgi:hypothetical protein